MILNNSSTLCSFSISIMFDPLSLSFCREPILIHLVPIKEASLIPLDEFPIIQSKFFKN